MFRLVLMVGMGQERKSMWKGSFVVWWRRQGMGDREEEGVGRGQRKVVEEVGGR
jgi:hypothetical protein